MNIIIIFFFLFSSLYATRIDKSFEMMQKHNSFIKLSKIVPISAKHSYSSKHFIIYWGNKKPATTLWIDENNNSIPDFIENTDSILEEVWKVEVNTFKFNKPSNNKIDVFMANTGVYIDGENIKLTDEYCGYSVKFNDYKYMVINDIPPSDYYTNSINMLKITLAHEFFHLIQYTYNDNFNLKDKWLYEGTAVLMEHLVFPKIPDYVYSYAMELFSNPNYGIVYPFSLFPYASILFFDHIYNQYGLEAIKKIWINMQDMDSLNSINTMLKDYNSSFKNELSSFYKDLDYNLSAFSNSSLLSEFKLNKLVVSNQQSLYLYNFGATYFDTNSTLSLALLDNNSSLDKDKKVNIVNSSKKIVINFNDLNSSYHLSTLYTSKIDSSYKIIKKGWSLISFNKDINVSLFDKYPIKIVWSYKNGEWFIHSKEYNTTKFKQIKKINSTDAVWIYANKDFYIIFDKFKIGEITYHIKGWNLVSFPVNLKLPNNELLKILKSDFMWKYSDNNWSYYSIDNKIKLNNIPTFNKISPFNGYWIRSQK